MSSISLPRVLQPRRGNSLDVERENFEKAQTLSISKAVNSQENPVKEKHVRNTIIGTFQEKGAVTFWNVVTKLPLQGNPIVCWKFCHTLHKLLREGHPNVIAESLKYRSEIEGLGRLWGHLKEGYGRLIACYTKLLNVKLDFHRRNPRFPGNLQVTADQLDEIGDRDVNNYFQLTVEMFDYMDEILNLQAAIFGSLDMSRSNSMTSSGQCRLAPLIPCIQDSSHLYDFCVKLLFKLHSSLPPDTLIGHSDRFRQQFTLLRQFYLNSSTLQYFKHLIQIPLLPDHPPNFLVQADLSSHMSPVVILPPRPETPDNDSIDMMLVDTLSTTDESFPSNGTTSPDQISDKERLIDQLLREIEDLKMEIQRIRVDEKRIADDLNRKVQSLEIQVDQLQKSLYYKNQETESLQQKLSESSENNEAVFKLAEAEKKAKVGEEKFLKMKDVYTKLREEHITLLRNKADIEKQLGNAMKASEDVQQLPLLIKAKENIEKSKEELQEKLQLVQVEKISLSDQVAELKEYASSLEDQVKTLEYKGQTDKTETLQSQRTTLSNCADQVESLVRNALEQTDCPTYASISCTPEYFLSILEPTFRIIDKLAEKHTEYVKNGKSEEADSVLRELVSTGYSFCQCILQGRATSNGSPNIEQASALSAASKDAALSVIEMLKNFKNKVDGQFELNIDSMRQQLQKLIGLGESLLSTKSNDEDISEMVDDELLLMDKAIEEAAQRIEELLRKSHQADSGVKLEVNGKILDTCTALMQAIKVLVQRSKILQDEIVSQGKGTTSVKEFYKRNHRWTEGFISAAKAVGLGAKFLVNAADRVIKGEAKFEELMVASNEIAASTAQLVVASKVKAERNSDNLARLSQASKGVTEATGSVVATAKSCAELLEESDVMDFTKLSLHQAKRLEMESQVRVLELESQLAQERIKLARLRKKHYTLAGPSEGWEEEDIPE